MKEVLEIILSLALLIAVVKYFLLVSIRLIAKYYYLKKNGTIKKAKIIDYMQENDSDGVTFYFPIIQFITNEGELIEGKLSIGKRKEEFTGKTHILIYSDLEKPNYFIEKSLEPLIIGWVSIVISILACLLVLSFVFIDVFKFS